MKTNVLIEEVLTSDQVILYSDGLKHSWIMPRTDLPVQPVKGERLELTLCGKRIVMIEQSGESLDNIRNRTDKKLKKLRERT